MSDFYCVLQLESMSKEVVTHLDAKQNICHTPMDTVDRPFNRGPVYGYKRYHGRPVAKGAFSCSPGLRVWIYGGSGRMLAC